ncbi:hypothetical protein [Neobacillus sp. YIM B06451]|uniref:hypothetical protein n=1 Tax=Neobacillus sp. YIM B06451 TaxID=3070994 RepID=UPI00292F499B|nr:hypothetical protein [Neobacillus sp. YIM B06451]
MKNIRVIIILMLFSLSFIIHTKAEKNQISQTDLEEILLLHFHKQIVNSVKQNYEVTFPQFEGPKIVSIKKGTVPEPSEELKPAKIYEIVIIVTVLNTSKKNRTLEITLNNDNPKGDFSVITIKKR